MAGQEPCIIFIGPQLSGFIDWAYMITVMVYISVCHILVLSAGPLSHFTMSLFGRIRFVFSHSINSSDH